MGSALPTDNNEHWLTLSEAAQRLGVHEGTVRRWADTGRLPSFRTPGGHRRFLEKDVRQFVHNRRAKVEADKDVESHVLSHAQREIILNLQNQPWHAYYRDQRSLERRATGQRLLAILLHYTASGGQREQYLQEAKHIMLQYGKEASALGMSLHDTAQAYLFFRRSLTNAVIRTKDENDPDSTVLIERLSEFLDDLLLAMIDGYTNGAS